MGTVFSDSGKAWVTSVINGGTRGSAADMKYVAWGTGAGTSGTSDTNLFTEASETRVVGNQSRITTTATNDTFQVVGTLTANGTKTITNAGLFDASTNGNMLIKGDFTGVPLLTNDQIQFTFTLQAWQ